MLDNVLVTLYFKASKVQITTTTTTICVIVSLREVVVLYPSIIRMHCELLVFITEVIKIEDTK